MYSRLQSRTRRRGPARTSLIPLRPPTIVTVVEPPLRTQIDCAAREGITRIHAASVSEAGTAVREHRARAILISPSVLGSGSLRDVAELVGKSPGLFVGKEIPYSSGRLLDLGACGVRSLVDLGEQDGSSRLRSIVGEVGTDCDPAILAALEGTSAECKHFFGVLVRSAPTARSVRALARLLEVTPSTLMSRFFRASLPTPRLYLIMTRLTYAAWLLEKPGVSIASVAYHLQFSSPQSFCRHIRCTLGLTASELRREIRMDAALKHLVSRLIEPHLKVLQTFEPLRHRPLNGSGYAMWNRRSDP